MLQLRPDAENKFYIYIYIYICPKYCMKQLHLGAYTIWDILILEIYSWFI